MNGSTRGRVLMRLAFYGGVLFVGLPGVFAVIMTRTHHAAVSPNPRPPYAEVELLSDGLRLRAWLARDEGDRPAVIIVHGLGDTLESYQEHGQAFLDRGHTVLLLDLRGHGGSEGSTTTLGGRESEDVRAAMGYLKREGLGEEGFVLMGHSMGAVAVILAAADRPDVRAVIAEAPYDTYRNTVAHHARILYGLPSWVPLIPLSIHGAEWLAGFDADDIDAVAAASRIEAPLLAIVDGDDRRMPEPVVRRIVDAHRGSHRLWVASGVDHVGAIYHPDWQKVVLGFLDDHQASSSRANLPASSEETGTPPEPGAIELLQYSETRLLLGVGDRDFQPVLERSGASPSRVSQLRRPAVDLRDQSLEARRWRFRGLDDSCPGRRSARALPEASEDRGREGDAQEQGEVRPIQLLQP